MIKKLCGAPPFEEALNAPLIKILSLYKAYTDKYDFARFFVQEENGKAVSMFLNFYSSVFLFATEMSNFDELKSYFMSTIYSEIFTDKWVAEKIDLNIMSTNNYYLAPIEAEHIEKQKTDYKAVHKLLLKGKDGQLNIPPFEDFYVDMCHRVRHNTATMCPSEHSVAITGFETESFGLVGGVATAKEYRRKGEGKRAVEALRKAISPKRLTVVAGHGAEPFYEAMGFEKINEVVTGE